MNKYIKIILKDLLLLLVVFSTLFAISFSRLSVQSFSARFLYQAIGYLIIGILLKKYTSKRQTYISVVFILLFALYPIIYHSFSSELNYIIRWYAELFICISAITLGLFFEKIALIKKIFFLILLLSSIFIISSEILPYFSYNRTKISTNINIKSDISSIENTKSLYNSKDILYSLKQHNGKIIMLDFWFNGCLPCKLKDSSLLLVAEHFKNDSNFVLIKINTGQSDSYRYFKKMYKEEINIISLHDSLGKISTQLKIDGYPTEIIFNKAGAIIFSNSGFTGNETTKYYVRETIKKIEQLLKEKK